MANLNFQQPPRSIANSSLNNRGSGGFGGVGSGNSLSGHVTPTSSMFQPNNTGGFGGQSQLSPNRNAVPLGGMFNQTLGGNNNNANQQGRPNLFGPRTMNDRRQMQGLGPMVSSIHFTILFPYIVYITQFIVSFSAQTSIGSFMQSRGYGQNSNNALSSFHSVFGNNDTGTPPLLDLSEFPSLTNARGNDSMPQSNIIQTPGSKPYGDLSFLQFYHPEYRHNFSDQF